MTKDANEPHLTEQFLRTLRSMFQQNLPAEPDERQANSIARIRELLALDRPEWRDAYEIELLLGDLLNRETLRVELGRRLVEARRVLHEDTAKHYDGVTVPDSIGKQQETPMRALYTRLINDLQWRYTIRETKDLYLRKTMANTNILFLGSVFTGFFIAPPVCISFAGEYAALILAALAGLVGACFSMLLGQRSLRDSGTFSELKMTRRWNYTFSRASIGLGAGVVLYFFLASDFLSGAAFPDLDPDLDPARTEALIEAFRGELRAVAPGGLSPDAQTAREVQHELIAGYLEALLLIGGEVEDLPNRVVAHAAMPCCCPTWRRASAERRCRRGSPS